MSLTHEQRSIMFVNVLMWSGGVPVKWPSIEGLLWSVSILCLFFAAILLRPVALVFAVAWLVTAVIVIPLHFYRAWRKLATVPNRTGYALWVLFRLCSRPLWWRCLCISRPWHSWLYFLQPRGASVGTEGDRTSGAWAPALRLFLGRWFAHQFNEPGIRTHDRKFRVLVYILDVAVAFALGLAEAFQAALDITTLGVDLPADRSNFDAIPTHSGAVPQRRTIYR